MNRCIQKSALLFLMAMAATAYGEEVKFVHQGKPLGVIEEGGKWKRESGYLECHGEGKVLMANRALGEKAVHVKARLAIDRLDDTAASFIFGENNNFGFDGRGITLFTHGPLFHGDFKPITDAKKYIEAGKPFDFEMIRKDGHVTFMINGKAVHRVAVTGRAKETGSFGLRPWRSTMRVYELSASGDLSEPLPFIEPTRPQVCTIPTIDLAHETKRQVVVEKTPGQYLGHTTTILLDDGKTLFCTYSLGHGTGATVLKKSTDGGLTWSERLPVPKDWGADSNCPSIHRLRGPDGIERLFVFRGRFDMAQAMSLDQGKTWTSFVPNGLHCTVVPNTIIPLSDGRLLMHFAREEGYGGAHYIRVFQSISNDGGLTWQKQRLIVDALGAAPDEPGSIKSPDGKQILSLLRENSRKCNSLYITSDDEGQSWTLPKELPAALTGDRHMPRYAPDGRLVVTFRDVARNSVSYGDWVVWVGTYDDIIQGREGQYRMRLMDDLEGYGDCGYAGLEVLPDGTFAATTYGHWIKNEKPFIMCVRFKLDEMDKGAKQQTAMQRDAK